jgi:hypothetical protein
LAWIGRTVLVFTLVKPMRIFQLKSIGTSPNEISQKQIA